MLKYPEDELRNLLEEVTHAGKTKDKNSLSPHALVRVNIIVCHCSYVWLYGSVFFPNHIVIEWVRLILSYVMKAFSSLFKTIYS